MKEPRVIVKPIKAFTRNRKGQKPIAIVIHHMEGTMKGTYAWFNRKNAKTSAHFGISERGEIWHFVGEEHTAWANGIRYKMAARVFPPGVNPNELSLSIELEGYMREPVTEAQFHACVWLVRGLASRWNIPIDTLHVIPHNSIDASKECPGTGVPVHEIIRRAQ